MILDCASPFRSARDISSRECSASATRILCSREALSRYSQASMNPERGGTSLPGFSSRYSLVLATIPVAPLADHDRRRLSLSRMLSPTGPRDGQ